jgi:hypothetical protein
MRPEGRILFWPAMVALAWLKFPAPPVAAAPAICPHHLRDRPHTICRSGKSNKSQYFSPMREKSLELSPKQWNMRIEGIGQQRADGQNEMPIFLPSCTVSIARWSYPAPRHPAPPCTTQYLIERQT